MPYVCLACGESKLPRFSIPENPIRSQKWLNSLNIPKEKASKYSRPRICLKHFDESNIVYENGKPCLIKDACPILNPVTTQQKITIQEEESEEQIPKNRRIWIKKQTLTKEKLYEISLPSTSVQNISNQPLYRGPTNSYKTKNQFQEFINCDHHPVCANFIDDSNNIRAFCFPLPLKEKAMQFQPGMCIVVLKMFSVINWNKTKCDVISSFQVIPSFLKRKLVEAKKVDDKVPVKIVKITRNGVCNNIIQIKRNSKIAPMTRNSTNLIQCASMQTMVHSNNFMRDTGTPMIVKRELKESVENNTIVKLEPPESMPEVSAIKLEPYSEIEHDLLSHEIHHKNFGRDGESRFQVKEEPLEFE